MEEELLGNTGYKVTKADLSESGDVWKVIKECSDWLVKKGLDHWVKYYTKEAVEHKFINQNVYLVRDEHTPIATVTLDTRAVEYYTPENINSFEEPKARALYITSLAVLPEYQGKGIATELLAFAENQAKKEGINFIRFDCRKSYTDLIKFYQKRGYQIVGELLDDEDNDERYCLMEKKV